MGLLDRVTFKQGALPPPEAIDVTERGELQIDWPGGHHVLVPPHAARDACPCAECVEEGSGRKILDPATIPADIRPTQILPVASYAVQIHWSDGHSTGLYTWSLLRRLSGIETDEPG